MILRCALLGLLATLWATAGVARAEPPATDIRGSAQGRLLSGVVTLAAKQVPLPEGSWVLVGSANAAVASIDGAYGAIANVVLFRLQGRVVDAALELNVNELPVTDGWGLSADCDRTDLVLAVVRYRTGWDGSCFFVTHSLAATPVLPPAWEQALRFAASADLIMAPVWVTAGFRVANRRDLIDARFQFSPVLRGVPVEIVARWEDSAWYGERLNADPRRLALATDIVRWSGHYGGWLEAGLKGRLDPALSVPMPGSGTSTSMLQQRLVLLSRAAGDWRAGGGGLPPPGALATGQRHSSRLPGYEFPDRGPGQGPELPAVAGVEQFGGVVRRGHTHPGRRAPGRAADRPGYSRVLRARARLGAPCGHATP